MFDVAGPSRISPDVCGRHFPYAHDRSVRAMTNFLYHLPMRKCDAHMLRPICVPHGALDSVAPIQTSMSRHRFPMNHNEHVQSK